jgi:hypothetical protein
MPTFASPSAKRYTISATNFTAAQTVMPHNAKLISSASPMLHPCVSQCQIGDDSSNLPENSVVQRQILEKGRGR